MTRCSKSWALAALCAALGGCGYGPSRPEGDAAGPRLYETCATCHGANGEGNQQFRAPAIAGLPEWYVRRQLEKFRDGHRGAHPADTHGLRMRNMVRTLRHDGDFDAIIAHVTAMPAVQPEPVMGGDAARGREAFAPCVECHGANAAGDVGRDAPPLTSLNDWYIVAQLAQFKAGTRGTTAGDATGASMRPMALGLADEQQMADVAAYIATLRGQ
ncbi:MAG: c-type cytochrome [Sandaracinaceae bacterium]|nr:c-type cytochrome [Sandaracinaceae bacterium]